MQIMYFTLKRRIILLSNMCYVGIYNGDIAFSVFFVVGNMAYDKCTGFCTH